MKIALVYKSEKVESSLIKTVKEKISASKFELVESNPDVVIFIGGDGTFLKSVHQYVDSLDHILFIGLCTGHLGFFFDYHEDEIDSLLSDLAHKKYVVDEFSLLEAKAEGKVFNAVNEIRIESPFHSLISEVYINDEYLETFRGNGLVVCSSIGSTAYNKSLSGAVVKPNIETLQLSEIAPINNAIYSSLHSSIVLDKDSKITLKAKTDSILIGYDQFVSDSNPALSLDLYLSTKKVSLAHKADYSYTKLLREKFIGKK